MPIREQPRQALGYGFYPPDNPIPVPVAAQSEAGIYVLTLTGQRRRDERESSRQFWFYQPEP